MRLKSNATNQKIRGGYYTPIELTNFIVQNVYDKRNEMQNINEELREMREQIHSRLDKMENQQKVQLDGLAFMMKLSGDQYTNKSTARVLGRQLLNKKKDGFDEHLDQLLQFRNIPSLVTSMRIVIMMMKRK